MTAFPADPSSSGPRNGRFGFIAICILGVVAGGIAGWRFLPGSGNANSAAGGHSVRAAMVSTSRNDTAPLVLAQAPAQAPAPAATPKDLPNDLRAFGGLTGLRAAPTKPAGDATAPAPPVSSEPAGPDLSRAAEPNRQTDIVKPVEPMRERAPVKPIENPVIASTPPTQEQRPAEQKSLAVETVTPSQAGAEAALSDGEQAQFLQMASAMIRRGDIAGARVVLGRLHRQGSKVAAFQLAETFDPAALRSWNVRGMRGDEERARSLYEEAAAAGVPEAAERLKSLAAEAQK
jgi:hypothetical protein